MTIKISWSNFNKFPNNTFYWRGLDGTSIFCHFPPAETYMSFGTIEDVMNTLTKFKDKGRSNTSMLLFGDGDGGGGPQLEHIEKLSRWQDLDGIPKLKFSTFKDFFTEATQTQQKLMTWEGELYLEAHNGTYTSMSKHKHYNRYMEILLRDTELFYYFAQLMQPIKFAELLKEYCHTDIKEMWYIFMIDQFHDVLPGTCTVLTLQDTMKNFAELKCKCREICQLSIQCLLEAQKCRI